VGFKPKPTKVPDVWYAGGTPASVRRALAYCEGWLPGRSTLNTYKKRVEKMHRSWPKNRDYLAPPTVGSLVDLDPALLVTPPKGMESGYVPIATRQEWGGSTANSPSP